MIPILAAAVATLAPQLAKQGMDLLSRTLTKASDAGVEKVAQIVKEQTGIDLANTPALTPAVAEKLQAFEANNIALLEYYAHQDDNYVERTRIAAADRADARQMQQEALHVADHIAQRFLYFYATVITFLTFGFIFWAAFGHDFAAHPGSERIIDTTLGFLLGVALSSIMGFFFGSSVSSRAKDKTITDLAEGRVP